ncbi:sialate O-acetylesterase [Aurantibacter crassamenti]|uniref:sialate O-acetylesterase n=1 Tax=Aurantibacter crassamenti TaxID=1837375 RepID=UPI001939BD55|nr:sialate O-acetylesterase [Aurantibacter crassamenti]MBM1106187.1 sialate O-acetylesterase [Aurantibacter crassamenti]
MKNILILLCFFTAQICFGKLWMPSILSDNMVLQQNAEVNIWGWTTQTNETITITASWNNTPIEIKAHQGSWSTKIATPKGGGTYTLTVSGHEEVVIKNILIGEVWLGSGQSNMEWTPDAGLVNADEEIAKADYPNIRFFSVLRKKSNTPQDDLEGEWVVCTPETMRKSSAVAYFFGRKLLENLEVPIGLITSSWGGTPVEVWIEKDKILKDNELKKAASKLKEYEWWPKEPGVSFNAMINPITKFNIAGFIWYQGESNRANPFSYYKSFPLLISNWREKWDKELPFYFTQIAPYEYDSVLNVAAAIVRDAQLQTMLKVPKTGMVVTNDIGNLKDIHPINKQDVGQRLALWALAKNYGQEDIVYSGPIFSKMEVNKNKVTLLFDYSKSGLMKKGKNLKEFYVAGADKVFYEAKAKIEGENVVLRSSKVKKPIAVRFAFTDTALPNLFNNEGLPASAFRTDDWEINLE